MIMAVETICGRVMLFVIMCRTYTITQKTSATYNLHTTVTRVNIVSKETCVKESSSELNESSNTSDIIIQLVITIVGAAFFGLL